MDDVDHDVDDAKVASDGARGGFLGIGRAEQRADFVNDAVGGEGHGDDGARLHEGLNFRIEWLGGDVGVMREEGLGVEAQHFAAAKPEAGFLEALQDVAAVGFGDTIGFEKE